MGLYPVEMTAEEPRVGDPKTPQRGGIQVQLSRTISNAQSDYTVSLPRQEEKLIIKAKKIDGFSRQDLQRV